MTTLVHVGRLLTGRIEATVPVTALRWDDTLNSAGAIDCTVPRDVVRALDLRQRTHGMRSFLAVEVDGRVRQAGPITSRSYDYATGQLTLGAQGVWHWLDRRVIRPADEDVPGGDIRAAVFTVAGKSLGGIARALVERAVDATYCGLPIVLPPDEAGDRTESFPTWSVPWHGEQLRQITQRATDAPDIAFRPRRRADDKRYLEWVMLVGTEAMPGLSQGGPDWVFDATAPRSPVLGISTDEDATQQAQQVWVTGNGMEADILMSTQYDIELLDLGWPLTETDASHSTVQEQSTLDGHAAALLGRSSKPIETFTVHVRSEAVRDIHPGDYARLVTKADTWLGDMDRVMRIRSISGDLSDTTRLEMFPMAGLL